MAQAWRVCFSSCCTTYQPPKLFLRQANPGCHRIRSWSLCSCSRSFEWRAQQSRAFLPVCSKNNKGRCHRNSWRGTPAWTKINWRDVHHYQQNCKNDKPSKSSKFWQLSSKQRLKVRHQYLATGIHAIRVKWIKMAFCQELCTKLSWNLQQIQTSLSYFQGLIEPFHPEWYW